MRTVRASLSVNFALEVSASASSKLIWIYTGLCDIFFVSLVIYIQIPSEIFSLQGLFIAFVSLKILVILISLNLSSAALKETAPMKQRTSTIFSCPKSYLFSVEEYSTFEEWVAQDIMDDYGPLRQKHEHVL